MRGGFLRRVSLRQFKRARRSGFCAVAIGTEEFVLQVGESDSANSISAFSGSDTAQQSNKKKVLIVYATRYGHTRKIVTEIVAAFAELGFVCTIIRLGKDPVPDSKVLANEFECIVIGSPLYFGRLSSKLGQFIQSYHKILSSVPNAFFSVSLTAAHDDGTKKISIHEIVRKFLVHNHWQPFRIGHFAGALLYKEYGPITRFIMRRISQSVGTGTNIHHDYVYTNWAQVPEFVDQIASMLALSSTVNRAP